MALLPPLPAASRRQQVADVLRDAIISGRLPPGERLRERELSEQLRLSRAPVREALRQLEQEGLVVSYPYRGTEVLGISQEEVTEVLVPIRLTLERFAVRKALPRLTDADHAHLDDAVAHMATLAERSDYLGLADADLEFHTILINRSDQAHCVQLWNVIQPRVRAQFRRDAPNHPSARRIADQHADLLATLRAGDEDTACAAVEAHIRDMPPHR